VDAYPKGVLAAHGINCLTLDLGYFSRATGPDDEFGYNQLGINQLCWVPPVDCPTDRFARLNIQVEDRVLDLPHRVLVLGQVPGDTQHGLGPTELKAWLMKEIGYYAG